MPDRRAITALSYRWNSDRETLQSELRRAGYDPYTLEILPDPGSCGCSLARAIRNFQETNRALTAAEHSNSGWRY
jgi:peptidoglycan hydrolase-like protein with peptidoglycan-binding domain